MTKVIMVEGTVNDLVAELDALCKKNRETRRPKDDNSLLGLDLKQHEIVNGYLDAERNAKPGTRCIRWASPADENALRTVRRDLMALREKLLAGAGRRALLREVDYTLDQLDNVLAEM